MCLDWPKSPPPTSLTSTTKEAIKNAIIRGELKQVAIYSELALASQWEISKTPIHNALVELSGKGFVTILPRKETEREMSPDEHM